MVTCDKNLTGWHDDVDITVGRLNRLAVIRVIGVEAIQIPAIINRELTVFQHDTLTGERDDTLDDIFFSQPRDVLRVLEHDHLTTVRNIRFVLKLCHGDGQAVHDQPVAGEQSVLHARTFHVETSEYEGVDEQGTDQNTYDEKEDADGIFQPLVSIEET